MRGEFRQYEGNSADLRIRHGRIPGSALIDLNRLAGEGWETVTAVPLARVGGRTDFVSFILRRERG